MTKEHGFVFFYDWRRPLAKIPPKEFKELILAMIDYAESGIEPETISPKAELAADFIFPAIRRGAAISQKRSEAGKAGNEKRWSDKKPSQNIANDRKASQKTICDTDESQTIATKNKTKNKTINKNTPPLPPSPGGEAADAAKCAAEDDGFDRFWAAYPRREAKKDARAAWHKLNPDADTVAAMLSAIAAKAASDDWQREGGRFIPLPATWLRGERWTDDPARLQAEPAQDGSFDTDDFFASALKRSYGEGAAG